MHSSWAVTPVDARPSPCFSCRVSLNGPLWASSIPRKGAWHNAALQAPYGGYPGVVGFCVR
jgi:hypothetical protein